MARMARQRRGESGGKALSMAKSARRGEKNRRVGAQRATKSAAAMASMGCRRLMRHGKSGAQRRLSWRLMKRLKNDGNIENGIIEASENGGENENVENEGG